MRCCGHDAKSVTHKTPNDHHQVQQCPDSDEVTLVTDGVQLVMTRTTTLYQTQQCVCNTPSCQQRWMHMPAGVTSPPHTVFLQVHDPNINTTPPLRAHTSQNPTSNKCWVGVHVGQPQRAAPELRLCRVHANCVFAANTVALWSSHDSCPPALLLPRLYTLEMTLSTTCRWVRSQMLRPWRHTQF